MSRLTVCRAVLLRIFSGRRASNHPNRGGIYTLTDRRSLMRLRTLVLIAAAASVLGLDAGPARGACCYFAAKDKDVNQPAQKAFITWDENEKVESWTVQPKFEGNAQDFGMVVPTPGRPKLDEMPRDFFKELAVFTILEPMDLTKYKQMLYRLAATAAGGAPVQKA